MKFPRTDAWRHPQTFVAHAPPPPQGGLFATIAAVGDQNPDATALLLSNGDWTYGETLRRARSVARGIAECTPAGSAVAVLMRSESSIAVALLGCLGAGRTSLILNTGHPAERIAAILADARPAVVLVDAPIDPLLARAGDPVDLAKLMNGQPIAEPADTDPDWPMAVFYTSGSTGRPKGFVRTERQFISRGLRQLRDFQVVPADRILSLTSLTSGTTATWLITTLQAGASCGVAAPSTLGLHGLSAALRDARPSILVTIPTLMRLVMELPGSDQLLGGVRATYTVSEPLTRNDIETWRRVLPEGCRSMVSYGMTEANAIAGWFLPTDLSGFSDRLPIGFPRADYEYALVDDSGHAVPVGEAGLLWLRGMMLSPGEWQNGRVVPGRAVPDPDETGRLILSTNDLVRLRREGLLEFAGRADDMVKIRGNRVEPSEVEAAIRGHAGVADVAVLARQAGDTTAIDAFVVERPGTRLNSDDLFQHLRTVLPAHMVPARVRLLPALPRLPNGKVDRLALTAEADKSR